jgi:hypothetical protein
MAETTKRPTGGSHDAAHGHSHEGNPNVSHERGDIDIFQITAFGIGLFISCVVVVFAMWAMFNFLSKREDAASPKSPMAKERMQLPPEPRVQGIGIGVIDGKTKPEPPRVELKQLRDDEDAILGDYALLDPAKGIARIPITLAIDLVAKKGLASKPSATGSDNDGFRMIPSDASSGRTFEKISQ